MAHTHTRPLSHPLPPKSNLITTVLVPNDSDRVYRVHDGQCLDDLCRRISADCINTHSIRVNTARFKCNMKYRTIPKRKQEVRVHVHA